MHLLNIKIEAQFPASLAESEDEVTGTFAILMDRTIKATLFSSGAPTSTKP